MVKIAAFLGSVAAFTYYGYGRARHELVKQKLDLVEKYSVSISEK